MGATGSEDCRYQEASTVEVSRSTHLVFKLSVQNKVISIKERRRCGESLKTLGNKGFSCTGDICCKG